MLNYQRVPSGSYLYIAMENHQFFLNTKNMGHFRYVNVFWRLKYRSCILNGTKNLDFHQERTQTRRMPSREKQSFIEINEPIYPIIVGCNISVYIYIYMGFSIYIYIYIVIYPISPPWSPHKCLVKITSNRLWCFFAPDPMTFLRSSSNFQCGKHGNCPPPHWKPSSSWQLPLACTWEGPKHNCTPLLNHGFTGHV